MIFGSKSSPCSATYVKNVNKEGFLSQFPESAAAIKKHTYADDHLESVNSVKDALDRISQVNKINGRAGFKMH